MEGGWDRKARREARAEWLVLFLDSIVFPEGHYYIHLAVVRLLRRFGGLAPTSDPDPLTIINPLYPYPHRQILPLHEGRAYVLRSGFRSLFHFATMHGEVNVHSNAPSTAFWHSCADETASPGGLGLKHFKERGPWQRAQNPPKCITEGKVGAPLDEPGVKGLTTFGLDDHLDHFPSQCEEVSARCLIADTIALAHGWH